LLDTTEAVLVLTAILQAKVFEGFCMTEGPAMHGMIRVQF